MIVVSLWCSSDRWENQEVREDSDRERQDPRRNTASFLTCCNECGLFHNSATIPVVAPRDDIAVEGCVDKSASLTFNKVCAMRSIAGAKAIAILCF